MGVPVIPVCGATCADPCNATVCEDGVVWIWPSVVSCPIPPSAFSIVKVSDNPEVWAGGPDYPGYFTVSVVKSYSPYLPPPYTIQWDLRYYTTNYYGPCDRHLYRYTTSADPSLLGSYVSSGDSATIVCRPYLVCNNCSPHIPETLTVTVGDIDEACLSWYNGKSVTLTRPAPLDQAFACYWSGFTEFGEAVLNHALEATLRWSAGVDEHGHTYYYWNLIIHLRWPSGCGGIEPDVTCRLTKYEGEREPCVPQGLYTGNCIAVLPSGSYAGSFVLS